MVVVVMFACESAWVHLVLSSLLEISPVMRVLPYWECVLGEDGDHHPHVAGVDVATAGREGILDDLCR